MKNAAVVLGMLVLVAARAPEMPRAEVNEISVKASGLT